MAALCPASFSAFYQLRAFLQEHTPAVRLINTSTIELKEFRESERPKYAILSHTWGSDDDEVTFRQMSPPTASRHPSALAKPGYQKVLQTCEVAKGSGYDWCWVDTCCIDKSSSAELTESINSMFRWYKEAEVCVVYLQDLSVEAIKAAKGDSIRMELCFRKCKCLGANLADGFTRGWTLQELLAPESVLFYDCKWNNVGMKDDLAWTLSKITGIPSHIITCAVLENCSTAEKFSWAAERLTTRLEDQAYSLLGIFDVYMPFIYGEGERAFRRLQEEIIRRSII